MLPLNQFKNIVEHSILIAIDLIVYNEAGEVLLGKRTNEPAKGYWFTPGGRVFKGETLKEAFFRVMKKELGIEKEGVKNFSLHGIYDHKYVENFFETRDFGTEYIVVAIKINPTKLTVISGDSQHIQFKFEDINKLMKADDVHVNVKNYFIKNASNQFF